MHLIVELTKYLMILIIAIYTYYSFCVFRYKSKEGQDKLYGRMTVIIFALHFIGYFILFLQTRSEKLITLYVMQLILFVAVIFLYQKIYKKLSKLLHRNMLMLLTIGFIVLARLSYDRALRQTYFAMIAFIACLIVPYIISKYEWIKRYGWVYGVIGILTLLVVLVFGTTTYGATNWLMIGGMSIQPSEFVKIIYVFSIAAAFHEDTDFKKICAVTIMAAANVLILVFQRDLGGALIFYVTYVFMLYVATAKSFYVFAGLSAGSLAAYIAYQQFYHVRVRVMAWQNPLGYIENEGFQVSQSLFAIGTGGWFGLGLNQGLPTSIPVVDSDFIFSAISEEFGGLFALCIVLIFINCFVLFINNSLELDQVFYRLISLGIAVMFGFQIILSIGGVIKFIPSTGVTLPLISYGGSSVFATVLMFMILQGVYQKGKNINKANAAKESEGP